MKVARKDAPELGTFDAYMDNVKQHCMDLLRRQPSKKKTSCPQAVVRLYACRHQRWRLADHGPRTGRT